MKKHFCFILLFPLLLSCSTKKGSGMIAEKFDVQGHRGCRGLMPENSIPGFIHAVSLGVTTIELDVVITGDKQVVVSHEPFMSSIICTDSSGNSIPKSQAKNWNIFEMTYEEVKSFDCGSGGHPEFPDQQKMKMHKPLLKDVIDAVESITETKGLDAVNYNIETKCKNLGDNVYHPEPEEFVSLLLKVINEAGIVDRTIIQSFDPRTLIAANDVAPDMKMALLVSNQLGFRHNLQRLDFKPAIFSPHNLWLTTNMIEFMHSEGIQVIPWTINKKERMKELIAMGVDGIITDYPDRLIEVLEDYEF